MGKVCVCIAHPLGAVSEDALSKVVIPSAQPPARCFFALRVGEAFAVRPTPTDGWVVLRLTEPGERAAPLPVARRVVTSKSSQ